jgi:uncharacterized membrane protein YGL010W
MSTILAGVESTLRPAVIIRGRVDRQFLDRRIDGRKPSFLADLRFLLLGPLFVLGVLYRRLNLAY